MPSQPLRRSKRIAAKTTAISDKENNRATRSELDVTRKKKRATSRAKSYSLSPARAPKTPTPSSNETSPPVCNPTSQLNCRTFDERAVVNVEVVADSKVGTLVGSLVDFLLGSRAGLCRLVVGVTLAPAAKPTSKRVPAVLGSNVDATSNGVTFNLRDSIEECDIENPASIVTHLPYDPGEVLGITKAEIEGEEETRKHVPAVHPSNTDATSKRVTFNVRDSIEEYYIENPASAVTHLPRGPGEVLGIIEAGIDGEEETRKNAEVLAEWDACFEGFNIRRGHRRTWVPPPNIGKYFEDCDDGVE